MKSQKICITCALAVCYWMVPIAQALPSGYGETSGHGSGGYLEAVPMLSDFAHIEYPKGEVLDLGEHQKFTPEKEIKVIRTIKISQPYPVHVPVKVPYPVPVIKPVPVEVTKVVKVPEPVHVDVVKSVQVASHTSGGGGDHDVSAPAHLQEAPQWAQQYASGGHSEASHFSSEGHGDESGNYAAVIAKHASEYQQNFQENHQESHENHQQ